MTRRQHVVPRETGWAVMPENGKRASKLLDKKVNAVAYAKKVASNQDTDVVVHKQDGKIQHVLTPQGDSWKMKLPTKTITPAQHVVPHPQGWAVKTQGNQPSTVKATKYRAVREAHKRADRHGAAMVIHNRDGTIKEIDSPPHYPSPISALLHT